jgi:hypothetical protein
VLGEDDALTFTYAGVLPLTRELNYAAADYRQVLNPEGLQALANVSYGFGKPGTTPLDVIHYKTRTLYTDGGFSYPAIRSREKNLTYTAKFFASESTSDIFEQRFNDDRLRGGRFRIDADMADTWRGINQLNLTISQGIQGLGSTANGNPLASRADGRVNFTKFEALGSRTQPLWGSFSAYLAAYGQCDDIAAVARAMRLRRPLFRPRLRSLGTARRQLLHGQCRAALRPRPVVAVHPGAALRVHRWRPGVRPRALDGLCGEYTRGARRRRGAVHLARQSVCRPHRRQGDRRTARRHAVLLRRHRQVLAHVSISSDAPHERHRRACPGDPRLAFAK